MVLLPVFSALAFCASVAAVIPLSTKSVITSETFEITFTFSAGIIIDIVPPSLQGRILSCISAGAPSIICFLLTFCHALSAVFGLHFPFMAHSPYEGILISG